MIAKKFRLKEREVKKVLQRGKPFFSYGIVLNSTLNRLPYNRFAIVIGGKSVDCNVSRVFFRRRFYDIVALSALWTSLSLGENKKDKGKDFVFVVKKQMKLNRKDSENLKNFQKDLNFLIKKVESPHININKKQGKKF